MYIGVRWMLYDWTSIICMGMSIELNESQCMCEKCGILDDPVDTVSCHMYHSDVMSQVSGFGFEST